MNINHKMNSKQYCLLLNYRELLSQYMSAVALVCKLRKFWHHIITDEETWRVEDKVPKECSTLKHRQKHCSKYCGQKIWMREHFNQTSEGMVPHNYMRIQCHQWRSCSDFLDLLMSIALQMDFSTGHEVCSALWPAWCHHRCEHGCLWK